ncbi:MAG: electron transfer flavoprotein subunit beta/FixA family protein [Anaerolineaceae bacterium]|nr:electron transfer flavoprotein subunit beta/FixA family protein [Anaerolineaceae bacterium]
MHIVTFTRSTPDTAARLTVDADGSVSQGDAAMVVNPWDEYSLEESIAQAEDQEGTATVIAIGPEVHEEALRQALAMGANEALRMDDPALATTASIGWATVAAAAVRRLDDVDLAIFGKEAVDTGSDQHQIQTARYLGWPFIGAVSRILELDAAGGRLRVERSLEQGRQVLDCRLPAVISVLKDINEPRYPSFMGIRRASRASIPLWSLADLEITLPKPLTQQLKLEEPPQRLAEAELLSGSPAEQAGALIERLEKEQVL